MWSWPHSQLLLAWPHRCDMHYHRSSCLWTRRPFPSLLSLYCQSWSQPLPNMQGQHTTPLSVSLSPSVIPFSGPTVTKINKKKKSVRIFQQSLSPSGFFCTVSSLFCEAAGLSRAADGLFKVGMSICRSGSQWQNSGEKKKRYSHSDTNQIRVSGVRKECEPLIQVSDPILLKGALLERRHRGSWTHQAHFTVTSSTFAIL